jgi:hypothetical protein
VVPTFTMNRSTREMPSYIPAASPRVCRSLSSWPPRRSEHPGCGVARPVLTAGAHGTPTQIHQVRVGSTLTGLHALVPLVHLLVSLAGPAPSGSTDAPRRCQDCFPPSPASPGSGCPQLQPGCCDSPAARAFHPYSVTLAPRGARTGRRTCGQDRPPPNGEVWPASPIPADVDPSAHPLAARHRSAVRLSALQPPSFSKPLPPFPMCPALPHSEYYGGSAPSRTDRSTVDPARAATPECVEPGKNRNGSRVHSQLARRRRSPTLSLRHRHGYPAARHRGLPGEHPHAHPQVPHPTTGRNGYAPHPARIHQIGAGKPLRDVIALVPLVLLFVTLAEPTPSGSTGTSRLCQGCSHPPRHLPGQAALSYTVLLRQHGDEGLPPPFELSAPHGARGSRLRARATNALGRAMLAHPQDGECPDAECSEAATRNAHVPLSPALRNVTC